MELTHAMVHCSFTGAMQNIKASDILKLHIAPKNILNKKGKIVGVKYKGKKYDNRLSLPVRMFGSVPLFRLSGNGWSKPGYSDVIERSGNLVSLIKYNNNDHVDVWEISNGAKGWNGFTRHICLIGGMADNGIDTEDNFTHSQYVALEAWIKATVRDHSDIKLIGHNQVSKVKACPGFNVPIWGRKIGLELSNLDFHNYGGGTHFKFLTDD